MALEIREALTDADLAEVRELLAEYVEFIASHWPQVDRGAFAEELRTLREMYPLVLIALADGEPAGCVMLRDGFGADAAEVRRLYVRPEYRRAGVGRALMAQLTAEARERAWRRLQLVAVVAFTGAIPLYESLGFRAIPPYRPSTMPPEAVSFMERALADAQ